MDKSVKELADEIGVTKQAIFKKIDNLGLRSKLSTVNNKLTIGKKEQDQIKSAFEKGNEKKIVNQQVDDSSILVVEMMASVVDNLEEQLKEKDKQIQGLQEQNKILTAALENMTQSIKASQALQAKTLQRLEVPEKRVEEQSETLEPVHRSKFKNGIFSVFRKNEES